MYIILYIVFSYMFILGSQSISKLNKLDVFLAPITFPIVLGQLLTVIAKK